jgi:hypothetical protein
VVRFRSYYAYLLTELSPSWEAANCAATQELPSILWNPKVRHRVHKSPTLVPILSQIDPTRSHPISLRSILILSTHLRLGLSSCLLPSGFPTNILYALLFPPIRATCPVHLILLNLNHSNYVRRGVQVMKLLIMQFTPISRHFISLQSKYSPQYPVLKHPQSMFLS